MAVDKAVRHCGATRAESTYYEDTNKIFTPRVKTMQVVVGVKKNRPR
jgi:hypothetical protein